MSFVRDRDAHTRGPGAIAARDNAHSNALRAQRRRQMILRERKLARYTYGPGGGIAAPMGAIDRDPSSPGPGPRPAPPSQPPSKVPVFGGSMPQDIRTLYPTVTRPPVVTHGDPVRPVRPVLVDEGTLLTGGKNPGSLTTYNPPSGQPGRPVDPGYTGPAMTPPNAGPDPSVVDQATRPGGIDVKKLAIVGGIAAAAYLLFFRDKKASP